MGAVVAGVDGFNKQWVVALVDGGSAVLVVAATAEDVLRSTAGCSAVAVDVPLGLADDGVRACELAARAELGSARSSIFPTPPRAVLQHVDDWPRALAAARTGSGGKGMSKQSFHILPGVKAFDELLVDESRVVEAHPELSFRALAPATTFVSKKTARGQGQRIAALAQWVDVASALRDVPDGPAMDDVLDALVCAWTAARFAVQDHRAMGGGQRDSLGKPMRIVV